MHIEGSAVIYKVGDITRFSATYFAGPLTVESFWNIIFPLYTNIHIGLTNKLDFDGT